MSSTPFKHDLFTQFATVAKALGNANRLELLDYLAQSERSVDELADLAGISVANTSKHLQLLRQSGLVVSRKAGVKVFYRLSGEDVVPLLTALRTVAERHIANVEQLVTSYLSVRDDLEAIAREELLQRAQDGLVTVLDVRPPKEFAAGHIAGAINVPLDHLEAQLDLFTPKQEIVAYCRGPHCVLAFDAVKRLRQRGMRARRLQDGFPEWRSAGLPTESADQSAD